LRSSAGRPRISDANTYLYVCGLKGMEEGVLQTLQDIAGQHGLAWDTLWPRLVREGRLHLETY
jgi:ferredoxin--NADP+ reductase/benzoyl-CoA 2,3-dioxygenase component A